MKLKAAYAPAFSRDLKRLAKDRTRDLKLLEQVVDLILENTPASKEELRRHHRAHALKGAWAGSLECHVANIGDWLLIWAVDGEVAYLRRTGTHDELFK